jgi:ABC-type polysaccharide/polyol phosphate transport system ATPase subunit
METIDREPAIETEGLSKLYSHALARMVEPPVSIIDRLRKTRTSDTGDEEDEELFEELEEEDVPEVEPAAEDVSWALREVTVSLEPGQVVAVVGPAASGKSSLLAVLGGTTPPTTGRAVLRGSVWPPLGWLTIFMDSSVTAPQNVVLAAKAAGVPRREVEAKLPEILELAGWQAAPAMRAVGGAVRTIALATALAAEPDVLLVDTPVLFGDTGFMDRCIERFEQLRARGSLILLEAPGPALIERLCDRIVWLDAGRLVAYGPTDDVLPAYATATSASVDFPQQAARPDGAPMRGFTAAAAIIGARAESESGVPLDAVDAREPLVIRTTLEVAEAPIAVRCGLALTDEERGTRIWIEEPEPMALRATGFHDCTALLGPDALRPGDYTGHVEAIVTAGAGEVAIGRGDVLRLAVLGAARPPAEPPGDGGRQSCAAEWAVAQRLESRLEH